MAVVLPRRIGTKPVSDRRGTLAEDSATDWMPDDAHDRVMLDMAFMPMRMPHHFAYRGHR